MAQVYQGAVQITDAFKYGGKKPLDPRTVVESYSDLEALDDSKKTHPGLKVFVTNEKKTYTKLSEDKYDWEAEGGGSITVEGGDAIVVDNFLDLFALSAHEGTQAYVKATEKFYIRTAMGWDVIRSARPSKVLFQETNPQYIEHTPPYSTLVRDFTIAYGDFAGKTFDIIINGERYQVTASTNDGYGVVINDRDFNDNGFLLRWDEVSSAWGSFSCLIVRQTSFSASFIEVTELVVCTVDSQPVRRVVCEANTDSAIPNLGSAQFSECHDADRNYMVCGYVELDESGRRLSFSAFMPASLGSLLTMYVPAYVSKDYPFIVLSRNDGGEYTEARNSVVISVPEAPSAIVTATFIEV